MARLYSNELKAIVVPENFLENPRNVEKQKCMRVEHFNYVCEHKRNTAGEVYGPTEPVIMRFTVRINSPMHARVFYKNLMTNGHFHYSFLFNATFDNVQRLADYEDGLVLDGYVTSVEELFDTSTNSESESEQIQLNIEILTRSVIYLSSRGQSNYKSEFIK